MKKIPVIIYTLESCPKCHVLKTYFKSLDVAFSECQDVEIMKSLGITSVPTIKTENGSILEFKEAMESVKNKHKGDIV